MITAMMAWFLFSEEKSIFDSFYLEVIFLTYGFFPTSGHL